MRSTMQDGPLLISGILRHGQSVYGESEVVTVEQGGYRTASFTEVAERAERLASALARLGVRRDDRVGTFCWNNQAHLEAYLAVPSMGAILHTLNIRLFPEQLAYVIDHAGDRVVIVDASLVPALARVIDKLPSVKTIIVNGTGDAAALGETLDYEALLAAETPGYEWPDLDEKDAAAMCYTSGTTGDPKGVVYSHRSTFLHSMTVTSAAAIGMTEKDKLLAIVPMFHANAWGTPYAAFMAGTSLVLPQMFLQGEHLVRIVAEQRPTLSCGVPTIWNDFLRAAAGSDADLSSLRGVTAGGSAVPRALIEAFEARVGIPLTQGWGMTETSPLAAIAVPPRQAVTHEDELDYRARAGRVVAGVEVRVVAPDGAILPNDGESVGEFEIRGPWVTASYYKDPDPAKFHHGWLRTGDVGTLDPRGYMQITDRTKDVIKSGGEWISSVELENEVMAHPDVYEAAVVAVPDAKWQERPLVAVVPTPGARPSAQELVEFLQGRVARWWLPERWTFVTELPKTSVGKFDKKVLRADHAAGRLEVIEVPIPPDAPPDA
ncbi:MAG: long-chain fatty acid--CoA ligase [Actinomycetota bacterium]|nr:long-chain fatty acid--CoA ligase [Actinomycetota bacterium]